MHVCVYVRMYVYVCILLSLIVVLHMYVDAAYCSHGVAWSVCLSIGRVGLSITIVSPANNG